MNSLAVSEVNSNAQLNTSAQRTVDYYRPILGTVIGLDQLQTGINYFSNNGFMFGQTLGIDVQGRTETNTQSPQPGIVAFAHELGVMQEKLVMPRLDAHTNKVLVVEDQTTLQYDQSQGRTVGFDSKEDTTLIDALIIKETPETKDVVLGIHGADCPAIVGSAELADGTRVIFGLHAGRKGCLSGIVENTASELIKLGVVPGSVRIAIGPGGQTLELPIETIKKEASINEHIETSNIWEQSAMISYSKVASGEDMVIYDNQADVIRRAQLVFGPLLADAGCTIIDANTLTSEGLRSYRAMTIASSAGDEVRKQEKFGRNAIFTRFN